MKRLLLLVAVALSCVSAHAQNVEGQIIAAQFGEFQVPTVGNGFSFPPASCQIAGGGKNFAAFTVGVPIKIVDDNPNLIEVETPVAVFITSSNCSVSMSTTYNHTSFYLTSGTGGLQEAINNGLQRTGGPNTVIINAEWYALVAPSNPATVIASVSGSTKLGLVDVTTTPYTTYAWNGTQYVVNTITGATIPATSLVLKGAGTAGVSTAATPGTDYVIPSGSITGTAGNLSGTPTLPNGTSAVTQGTGDNTQKLATDAFVLANSGGGTPGGGTTQGQFNNSGTFAGSSTFLFNTTTGTASNFSLANQGVFTSGQANLYLQSLINGCNPSTEYYDVQYTYETEGLTGCVTGPSVTPGTHQITGVAGYATSSNSGAPDAVGGYFQARALVNGAHAFGGNWVAQDVSGLTSGVELSNEFDVQPYNVPSAYAGGYGANIELVNNNFAVTGCIASAQCAYGFSGLYIGATNSGGGANGAYWNRAIEIGTAAANVGMYIHPQGTATSSVAYGSAGIDLFDSYWTGSASGTYGYSVQLRPQPGSGTTTYDQLYVSAQNGSAGSFPHYLTLASYQNFLLSFQESSGSQAIFGVPSGQTVATTLYIPPYVGTLTATGWPSAPSTVNCLPNVLSTTGYSLGCSEIADLASGATIGSPTGGAKGAGTLNATALYVNGVSVGSGSAIWSGLLSPTAALSLSMQAYQSIFTFNAATGTADLFKLTDTANNTGTGIMNHITTANGSTEIPWQADANGTGWQVNTSGNFASTNAVNNAAITFQAGSGGASTCPSATSGEGNLCANAAGGISYSNNGAAYSPLSAQPIPYSITSSSTPAINLNNGSMQYVTLSANATAAVSNITAGASVTMEICQPSSGGPYTWTWPAAFHGGIAIGTTASDCSIQEFKSFNGTTLVPLSGGVINVSP